MVENIQQKETQCMSADNLEVFEAYFKLLSQFMYCYPQKEMLAEYLRNDVFGTAPVIEETPELLKGLSMLQAWSAKWQTQSNASLTDATVDGAESFDEEVSAIQRDHLQLFEGVGEPKAASWASYYLATSSPILSVETFPVRRLYAKYGFEVTRKNQEPDDDLGIMLGFIAYLMSLEQEGKDTLADQRYLLSDRILPWLPSWLYSVEKFAKTSYCHGMGLLLFGECVAYAQRFNITYFESEKRFVCTQN